MMAVDTFFMHTEKGYLNSHREETSLIPTIVHRFNRLVKQDIAYEYDAPRETDLEYRPAPTRGRKKRVQSYILSSVVATISGMVSP